MSLPDKAHRIHYLKLITEITDELLKQQSKKNFKSSLFRFTDFTNEKNLPFNPTTGYVYCATFHIKDK